MIRALSVLSVLCLTMSASAFAMPAVGDAAQFDLDITLSNGGHYAGTVDLSLTQYDAAKQQYQQHQLVNIAGQSQTQDEWVDAKDLATEALVNALLGNCAGYGGATDTIVTPVSTFATCKMPFDNDDSKGFTWIGMATFGIIKQDSTSKKDGSHTILTIKSYHNG